MEDNNPSNPGLSWQEQRQEAIRRQQQRWQQLHPEAAQQQQQQPQQRPQQPAPAYPSIPAVHASGPLLHYPEVPAPSAPPLDAPAADWAAAATTAAEAERQRRQQQEEDDHRMAMELAEQFAAENNAADAAPGPGPDPYDMNMNLGLGSDDINDEDWEQIGRTASMSRMAGGTAGAGTAGGSTAAGTGPRPSSQAAAAAGSTAGGIIGAGLSALLAMAAQAAANRAQQAAAEAEAVADGQGASGVHRQTASASGSGAQHASATASNAGAGGSSTSGSGTGSGSGSGGGGGEGSTGVLGMAANALRSFLASRAAGQANSSAAAGGRSGAAGDDGERRWENEQPGAEDLAVLQNLMQTLMGGSLPAGFEQHQPDGPAAAAAGGGGGGARASSGVSGNMSGFRVTRLPGGGFTATYSSSSGGPGSGGVHVHTSTTHSSGAAGGMFPGMPGMGMDADDDMFGGPNDFLSQLLLAGARSARDNRGRAQGGQRAAGFTHYDPNSGAAEFEPFGPGFGPGAAGQGLEALLSQIMGPGLFGGGGGGMTYEDLVGLDPVHVTTPEEVLSSLPQSKYVEGRKPGDSDTCVICQTAYSVGDDLTHLPCLHAFHTECITPWLQGHSRKCPVCKTDVC